MPSLKEIFGLKPKSKRQEVPETPSFVLLEATNACNLRCRMCFIYGQGVTRKRPVGFVEREVWRAAIDEIGSWGTRTTLDLHGAGEPLLHPEIFDMVSLAKGKGNISVGFLSNATLLDSGKSRKLLESGIDWVGFSVDGADREIFEHYRKGASLELVEENIENFLAIRKGAPSVHLNMVMHEGADVGRFVDKWKGKVDTILLSQKRLNDKDLHKPVELKKPCRLLYEQLIVGFVGKAVLCCEDFFGDHVIGEFPKQSLREIWHGKAMSRARRLHESGRPRKLKLCSKCDSVVFHEYEESTVEREGAGTLIRRELLSVKT